MTTITLDEILAPIGSTKTLLKNIILQRKEDLVKQLRDKKLYEELLNSNADEIRIHYEPDNKYVIIAHYSIGEKKGILSIYMNMKTGYMKVNWNYETENRPKHKPLTDYIENYNSSNKKNRKIDVDEKIIKDLESYLQSDKSSK